MPIPFLVIGALAAAGLGGVASGASGAKKLHDANDKIRCLKQKYDTKKESFEKVERECSNSIEYYGEYKLKTWESFKRFSDAFEKIKNKPEFSGSISNEKFNITKAELDEIKKVTITAVNVLGAGVVAAGAGGAIAGGAISGVAAFGVASTGTAIASLSGAAATNATLAAIGGGSLATGGLGIAGGTAILGGFVVAPAIAVGGLFMNSKGNKSLEEAEKIQEEVNKACISFDESIDFLLKLKSCCERMYGELYELNKIYLEKVQQLEYLVYRKDNYNEYTMEEQYIVESNILLVKLIKNLTQVDILKKRGIGGKEQYIDEYAVNSEIRDSKMKRELLSI